MARKASPEEDIAVKSRKLSPMAGLSCHVVPCSSSAVFSFDATDDTGASESIIPILMKIASDQITPSEREQELRSRLPETLSSTLESDLVSFIRHCRDSRVTLISSNSGSGISSYCCLSTLACHSGRACPVSCQQGECRSCHMEEHVQCHHCRDSISSILV